MGSQADREVDGNPVQKNDIFIVKSDVAVPEITGVSPTAGPFDGGTLVTITGHGFELPVQVHFGTWRPPMSRSSTISRYRTTMSSPAGRRTTANRARSRRWRSPSG